MVQSKSKEGVWYRVYFDRDGHLRCNCPAGIFNNDCEHLHRPDTQKWIIKNQP